MRNQVNQDMVELVRDFYFLEYRITNIEFRVLKLKKLCQSVKSVANDFFSLILLELALPTEYNKRIGRNQSRSQGEIECTLRSLGR